MSLCRTCLDTPADKNMSELEKDINEDNKNYFDIMLFCLDIKVHQYSTITTDLCDSCYGKIISFYKFKVLSLNSDSYLKSLDPIQSQVDQNLSEYIDNDRATKNLMELDEYSPSLVENCIKIEMHVDDGNILGDVKRESDSEVTSGDITDDCDDDMSDDEVSDEKPKEIKHKSVWDRFKKSATKRKKRSGTKKAKPAPKNVPQGRQVCEDCGMSVIDLKAHALTHQPKDKRQMLQCKACPKMFITRGGRRRHYKIRHLGVKAKCEICDKEVVHLAVHKMQVHEPAAMPFACDLCERRFVSKPALDQHVTSHTLEAAFGCDICHKKFRAKGLLSQHIRQVHERERKHVCELCNKGFFCKSTLQEHLRTHGNERVYQCAECVMSFMTKNSLRKHGLVHSDLKRFKCEFCDMSFKLASTHGNERVYQCAESVMSFMTKNSLRKHGLVHSDLKRFKCEFCDMSFKLASCLRLHMVTHTKEKRYSCQYCGKRFGRPDSCRRHEAGHRKPAAD